MKSLTWFVTPLLLCALVACGGGSEGGTEAGVACVESTLVEQCPLSSNPILGATADDLCEASASGDLVNAEGAVSGRCFGESACRVACQFESPCRCGVESLTREAVVCVDCGTVSACGDGVCADGETVESCALDCGPNCPQTGDTECDFADGVSYILLCNLNRRWDRLPCPSGEICTVEGGAPECVRDDVVGLDVGGGDGGDVGGAAGEWIEGRIMLGDAPYTGTADSEPPVDAGRPARMVQEFAFGLPMRFMPTADAIEVSRGANFLDLPERATLFLGADPETSVYCAMNRDGNGGCWRAGSWLSFPQADAFCPALEACATTGLSGDATCETGYGFLQLSWPHATTWPGFVVQCVQDYLTERCEPSPNTLVDILTRAAPCPREDQLTQLSPFNPEDRAEFLADSPSSRHVLFSQGAEGERALWSWSIDDGTTDEIVQIGANDLVHGAITADGAVAALLRSRLQQTFVILHKSPGDAEATVDVIQPLKPLMNDNGVEIAELELSQVDALALSPNGRLLAMGLTSNSTRVVVLLDLEAREEVMRIRSAEAPVFLPRNHQLAVYFRGGVDGSFYEVWDLAARVRVSELETNVPVVAFSPSGATAATSNGRALRLWDVASGTRVFEGESIEPLDRRMRFSRDGAVLMTGSAGTFYTLWGP